MAGSSFWSSFLASCSLIAASELGDKTFFITSIMAVHRSRRAVFLGSLGAMTLMNVFSICAFHIVCLGLLTTNMPSWVMHYASISLFLLFGVKMVVEGFQLTPQEVQQEYDQTEKMVTEIKNEPKQLFGLFGTNAIVFAQTFSIVFFAEWGDKSQMSTILLAAKEGVWAVAIGAFVGYLLCNAIAVLGSRVIVKIISVQKVTIIGGLIFIACGLQKVIS